MGESPRRESSFSEEEIAKLRERHAEDMAEAAREAAAGGAPPEIEPVIVAIEELGRTPAGKYLKGEPLPTARQLRELPFVDVPLRFPRKEGLRFKDAFSLLLDERGEMVGEGASRHRQFSFRSFDGSRVEIRAPLSGFPIEITIAAPEDEASPISATRLTIDGEGNVRSRVQSSSEERVLENLSRVAASELAQRWGAYLSEILGQARADQ